VIAAIKKKVKARVKVLAKRIRSRAREPQFTG
jgi:hypothetical protein